MGIYDIAACSDKKLVVADNNSFVKFFNKGKLVKTLEDRCQFLSRPPTQPAHSNQIGKVVAVEKQHVYFINHKQTGVVKVDVKNYSKEEIPLEGDRIFQIAAAAGRVYAISEDGRLQVAYRADDSLQPAALPKASSKANPKEKPGKQAEASDDDLSSGEETKAGDKQMQIKAVQIPDIDQPDAKEPEPHNQSIIMGSEPEDDEPEEAPAHSPSSTRAKSALQSILTDIDKPRSRS